MAASEKKRIGSCEHCGEPLPAPPGHGRSKYCSNKCQSDAYELTRNVRRLLLRRGLKRRELFSLIADAAEAIAAGLAVEILKKLCIPLPSSAGDFYERAWKTLRTAKTAVGLGDHKVADEARRILGLVATDTSREATRLWLACQSILRDVAQEPICIKHWRAQLIERVLFCQRDWLNLAVALLAHANLWRSQPQPDYRKALQLAHDAYTILREHCRPNQPEVLILLSEASHWQLRNAAMGGKNADPFSIYAEDAHARLELYGGDLKKIGTAGSKQLRVESLREGFGFYATRAQDPGRHWKERDADLREAENRLDAAIEVFDSLPPQLQPQAHKLSFPRMEVERLYLTGRRPEARRKIDEFLHAGEHWHEAYAFRQFRALVDKYDELASQKIAWPSEERTPTIYMPGIPYLYLEEKLANSAILI